MTFTAIFNLDARQQELSAVATACRVYFILMMLHCSQHQHSRHLTVLDSMQSFRVAKGLTISIPDTKATLFPMCTWKVAGQDLRRNQSFTYVGVLRRNQSFTYVGVLSHETGRKEGNLLILGSQQS